MQAVPPTTTSPFCRLPLHANSARSSSSAAYVLGIAFFFLAVLQLVGCGVTYNALPLTVDPNSVSFGAVQIGKSQVATVTLHNQGLVAVTFSSVQADDPAFKPTSDQMNTTIPAGGSATVSVTFAPTAAKDYSSKIVVASGNQQTAFAVSGTGQKPQQTTVPPPAGSPGIQVSSTTLQFGSVAIGANAQQTLTVSSTGTAPLQISTLNATGNGFSAQMPSLPQTLQPGQSLMLPVKFGPQAVGAQSGKVLIGSNAAGASSVTVNLAGTGTQSTPPPSGSAAIQVSSTTLQFGSVPIGGNAQQTLTITSIGTAPLDINTLHASGGAFSATMPSLPQTLQQGKSLTIPVKFGPRNAGAQTGKLVIGSNAAGASSVTVNLAGSGTQTTPPPSDPKPALTLSSTAVDFGSVAVGSQGSKSVTLTSSGTAAVVIQSFAVSGDGFSTGNVQTPLTLAPGQQIALPLTFTPSGAGAQQGKITLTDNATGSPNGIALAGTGTNSASLSIPSDVDFGDVTVGSSGSKTITLVSDGTAPVTIKSIAVAGGSFSGSPQALPQVLQPNQQMSVKVKFSPTADGSATGSVTVSSSAAANASAVVHVHGKGIAATAPALSASASSLSFGQVAIGSPATKTLTVTSNGTAPATISGGSITGDGYTATYAGVAVQKMAPVTLQPGQQVTFDVVFDPTATGNSNGQLSLSTDTGSPLSVSLSGKGIKTTSPGLTLSAPSLDFGDIQMGSKKMMQLTLTSSGTAPMTISSGAIAGKDFQISSATYPSGTTGWPATLQPGQQVVLSITFSPDAVDSFTGNLALTSDASGGTANVPLSGTGDAVPAPDLTLSATSINFGQVTVGSKGTRTLTLTSTGNAPLNVSAITVSGAQFSVSLPSLPATLQPNQQLTLTLTYQPTAEGQDSGTLAVTTNDSSGPATVSLGGSGTAVPAPQLAVNPTAVNFGDVPVNTSATKTVTLSSSGTAALTITAANLTGSAFSVSGASFPLTLNPNQSATLQVQFHPTAAATASGQLTITSNAAAAATTQISLSGIGTAITTPQLTVSDSSLAFGSVAVNSTATLPLTLTSSGTAPLTINSGDLSGTGFAASGVNFPVTLNPTQSVTLNVKFNPQAAGNATGQLTITSNASSGASTVVQLSGTGTVTAVPQLQFSGTSLAFGDVTVSSTKTLSLTLISSGTGPVTINSAKLQGTGFSDSGAAFPLTLNPNQSVTLQVQFDPTATGSASGTLTISSNSSTGATTQIQLSGNGLATQHEIDLNWDAPANSSDPVAGYNIYRSTDGGGSFSKLNASAQTQVTYVDGNVQSGSSYVYEVKSVDASGSESGPSNQITLSVP